VRSEEHLATVIGLDNIVVVATGDAVLVADKSRTDKVKQLVEQLKAQGHPEATRHRRTYRPWGYYQSIDQGARYQVKRLWRSDFARGGVEAADRLIRSRARRASRR
jgi:mannose-1-phosphate guanylyltransferase/mannose-6-phosphate isomerase